MYKIKTKEAACLIGKGTRWCTAANNNSMFDYYNEQGPLYIIIDKETNEKYQLHLKTRSFMDADDSEVELEDILKYETGIVLNALIKDDINRTRNFLTFNDNNHLLKWLSDKDLLTLIKHDPYDTFIYYCPKGLLTKEMWLTAFKNNPTIYTIIPTEYKTPQMSVKYAQSKPSTWETIPNEHRDYIHNYLNHIKNIKSSAADHKSDKSMINTIKKMPPEIAQKPEVQQFINDQEQRAQKSKQHLRGFKDIVKDLRQQRNNLQKAK